MTLLPALHMTLFASLVLVIALFCLCLSGHFPIEHQKPELRAWHGRTLLVGSIILIVIASAKAFGFALERLPAPFAIIAGGAALLAAPLVLQRFPDSFVDGRRGIATLAALATALTIFVERLAP
jgi:hypothetical protein